MILRYVLISVLLFGSLVTQAQITVNLTGAVTALKGQSKTYQAQWRDGANLTLPPSGTYTWTVTGGTKTSSNDISCTVNWTTAGYNSIVYEFTAWSDFYTDDIAVTVNNPAPAVPNPTFTIVQSCGSTTITRTGTPPAGVAWYWHIGTTPATTLGSAASLVLTAAQLPSPANLYLSARNTATPNEWSTTSKSVGQVSVVSTTPSAPVSAVNGNTITNGSAAVSLTVTSVSGATKYRWYNAASGGTLVTETSVNTYAPVISQSTDYYVSASNGVCESSGRRMVTGFIHPVPQVVSVGNPMSIFGRLVKLQVVSYAYDTYQWKKNGVNISGATASTYETNQAGVYSVSVTKGNSAGVISNTVEIFSNVSGQALNYITSYTSQRDGIVTDQDVANATVWKITEATQYFDDHGRPLQAVIAQGSPALKDIVQPTVYDAFGRQTMKYEAYVSGNTGDYKSDFIDKSHANYTNTQVSPQYGFYQAGGSVVVNTAPYAETRLENSPLNRVIKQGFPGTTWQPDNTNTYASADHTIKNEYGYNDADEVVLFKSQSSGTSEMGLLATTAKYSANELLKNKTKDENNQEVIQYTDKQERVVLRKLKLGSVYAETYYVYDDFGQLTCVLPPEALNNLATGYTGKTDVEKEAFLAKWTFRYRYDAKKQMIKKQVPGTKPVYMVYDAIGRLVFTQDGVRRERNQWTYTQYDVLDRPLVTGVYTHTADVSQETMTTYVAANSLYEVYDGSLNYHGYTNTTWNTTNFRQRDFKALTVTYYDTYDYRTSWGSRYEYATDGLSLNVAQQGVTYTQPATAQETGLKGQVTGMKVRVLYGAGDSTWLRSASYYDEYYRVIQTISDNQVGGMDRISSLPDFTGKILKTRTTQIEYDFGWQHVVNLAVGRNSIVKTAGANSWGDAGMSSRLMIPSYTDGWLEVTTDDLSSDKAIGFSTDDTDTGYGSIDFALYVQASELKIYEQGILKAAGIPLRKGDILRVQRVSGFISCFKNGEFIYQSPDASTAALLADVSIFSLAKSTWRDMRASFAGEKTRKIDRKFEYDHAGRLLKTWHRVDGQTEVLLSKNEYNELGQVVDKKLHSLQSDASDTRQSIDYRYGPRGWLTSINNAALAQNSSNTDSGIHGDLFGMELEYEKLITGVTVSGDEQYNGNISSIQWSNSLGLPNTKQRGYRFRYDALNRLTEAFHKEKSTSWTATEAFKEGNLLYDLNGNIKQLDRNGKGGSEDDKLAYVYNGNQLLSVTDAGDVEKGFVDGSTTGNDYVYDNNGNMIVDKNKKITVVYNHLNLPRLVKKDNGDSLRYTYDATGRKLSQHLFTVASGLQKKSDYAGEFFYENDSLKFINHEEGRVVTADPEGDDNKTPLYSNNGSTLTGISYSVGAGTTAELEVLNSKQYVKATNICPGDCYGASIGVGPTVSVQPGEIYKLRVKAFSTGPKKAQIMLRSNYDPAYLSTGNYLPVGQASEEWTEVTYTVPAGVVDLFPILVWWEYAEGEMLYVSEIEFYKLKAKTPTEYQYHLKDHLGNVRLTFTEKDEIETSLATLEDAQASEEEGQFLYYDEAITVNEELFDHTHRDKTGTQPSYRSTRLLGPAVTDSQYGLAKSISVMPGDVIHTEVYAKYVDTETNPVGDFTNILLAIANAAPGSGIVVDGGGPGSTGGNNLPFPPVAHNDPDNGAPRAYLNFIVYGANMEDGPIDMGFVPITQAAGEHGQNGTGELLSKTITIKEAGYVYIYLSNDNPTLAEVYFDDFKVEHVKSPVIQSNDYYPFGETFNLVSRENGIKQLYLFGGKEIQDELNVGWLDFGARMYDPKIGRWNSVDPMAEVMTGWSVYNYVFDNPMVLSDPSGMLPVYDYEQKKYIDNGQESSFSEVEKHIDAGDYEKDLNLDSSKGATTKVSGGELVNFMDLTQDSGKEQFSKFAGFYFKDELEAIKSTQNVRWIIYDLKLDAVGLEGTTERRDDGIIEIRISAKAMSDAKLLYLTVGHELVHATDMLNGNYERWTKNIVNDAQWGDSVKDMVKIMSEYHAYQWDAAAEKGLNGNYGAQENLEHYTQLLKDYSLNSAYKR